MHRAGLSEKLKRAPQFNSGKFPLLKARKAYRTGLNI